MTESPSYEKLNDYSSSVLSLKHKGLADLPDGGTCIRLAPDFITGKKWLLNIQQFEMWLKFADVIDREIIRGTMR
jgi:hypothetical protein